MHKRADNGFWGFVGGAMEPGESLKDCVKREVKEETGIEVWIKDLCCVDSDPTQFSICQYNDGNIIQYCGITFICVANDLTLMRMSPESCDMRIVYSNLLPEPFLPLHRWRLEQARHIFYERHVSYM